MKHTLEINLDDEQECAEFIEQHGTNRGKRLANRLGLKGKGSVRLASSLSNYAWNKHTAIYLRLQGNIQDAQRYEAICDRIYSADIQPRCDCW